MAIKNILIYPDEGLRCKSDYIKDLSSEECVQVVQDLKDTLVHTKAHGLAAPQIGVFLRAFASMDNNGKITVYLNPEIKEKEGNVRWQEGCLSFPGVLEYIQRFECITIKAFNEDGEEFIHCLEDLEAIAAQHEYDHLDGVLFIDRVSKLKQRYMLKKLAKVKKSQKRFSY